MQLSQKPIAVVETPATNSGMPLEVKRAVISASSTGDNTIIAAVSGKIIRVLSFCFVCAAAVTVRFESGASGTALTGQMQFAANSGLITPHNYAGHFQTASGALLNMELSGAVAVEGWINYVEV